MKYFLLILVGWLFFSCKKEFNHENNVPRKHNGNILSLNDAKQFLRKSINQDFSKNNVPKKIASVKNSEKSSLNLNDITLNMQDSVYEKFYWDYAIEEDNIYGYPAILVPIKMDNQLNSSLVDGMSSKGYRVAVFQHDYSKNNILLSFRDYHPFEDVVLGKMQELSINSYPSNFIEFHYLLGQDFSGHIVFVDDQLRGTRIAEVNNNKLIKYINISFENTNDENLLISHPADIIFQGGESKECEIQIAYPDFEISYTKERYIVDPVGQYGSNSTGMHIYGFSFGMRTVQNIRTVWKTETIPVSNCGVPSGPFLGGGAGVSPGVGILLQDKGASPDDCARVKNLLANLALNELKNDSITRDKKKEAGYSMYYKDVNKRDIYTTNVIPGGESSVDLPINWNPVHGYHIMSNHFHPTKLPFSFSDVLDAVDTYNSIDKFTNYTVAEKTTHRQIYLDNYMKFVESGNNIVYAYTIKNIDKLNAIASAKTVKQYMKDEEKVRNKLVNDDYYSDVDAAELLLLDTFGDSIHLYKGKRDKIGKVTFTKLTREVDKSGKSSVKKEKIDCN